MNTSRISTVVFRRIKFLFQLFVDQNKLIKSLFLDLEFPRGMGDQVEKSWKFQGVGGVKRSLLERKIQWGGGVKLEKTLRGRGMDIFWNHTLTYGITVTGL